MLCCYIIRLLPLLLASLLFYSCTPTYEAYDAQGAEEFVLDSYKIRQGKFSILEMEGQQIEALSPSLLNEYKDTIQENDILNIAVYHPSREDIMKAVKFISDSVGYRVENGLVHLPDLEPIEISGLTLEEARLKIQKNYLNQIADIGVFIAYKDRLTRKVDLIGMVSIPTIPVDGRVRLYEILSKAHVPDNANLFFSYIVRDNKPLPVDMYKLIVQGDMTQNIVMQGGDKIFIANPAQTKVMVMGEVGYPKALDLPSGYMSLREAIVKSGGIAFTGDKSYIQVIRGNIAHPKVYTLNWNHILQLPNDSLLLMPGDTVYIAATPIAEWNRFISQLLPSFNGMQVGYSAYQLATDRK
jgi:polysaccharide export outer membrane protein